MTDAQAHDATLNHGWSLSEDLVAPDGHNDRGVARRTGQVATAAALASGDASLLAQAAVLHDIG